MVKIVVGAYPVGNTIKSKEEISELLSLLKLNDIKEIDSAAAYTDSERLIGLDDERKQFAISTKAPTFYPGSAKKETVTKNMEQSLKDLQQDQVDIYYYHAPDAQTSFEEQASTINEFHKKGQIKRFGISNFSAEQVQTIYDICKKNNYILPSVYQGNYNLATRNNEGELFPLLKKLKIAYYAYSPLAGGLFVKSIEDLKNPPAGSRFHPDNVPVGTMYRKMYINDTFLKALENFRNTCKEENEDLSNVAFRWLLHHSQLSDSDAIIMGFSTNAQLKDNLAQLKGGPLPSKILSVVEKLWEAVADKAPQYHF